MKNNPINAWEKEQKKTEEWFTHLRNKICDILEELEKSCSLSSEISPA